MEVTIKTVSSIRYWLTVAWLVVAALVELASVVLGVLVASVANKPVEQA